MSAAPSRRQTTCSACRWWPTTWRRAFRSSANPVRTSRSIAFDAGRACWPPSYRRARLLARQRMHLSSPAFSDAQRIPRRFTCDGEDLSVPLQWSDVPAETRSLVLLCEDPDAPAGVWHHWAVYDIPPNRTELAEGIGGPGATSGLKQAINDFGRTGYGGPCPPHRHGPHRYHFRLLALSVDQLPVRGRPSCQEVERQARTHAIAEATVVGLYER